MEEKSFIQRGAFFYVHLSIVRADCPDDSEFDFFIITL